MGWQSPRKVKRDMISKPYDHQHPLFQDQQEYKLTRAVLDSGDESNEATAILAFRHQSSGRMRTFRFFRVALTVGVKQIASIRGYLPVYVASLEGRGWEQSKIEVGDTDPGDVWFWAESLEEIR